MSGAQRGLEGFWGTDGKESRRCALELFWVLASPG
jgi:hypothetical protein